MIVYKKVKMVLPFALVLHFLGHGSKSENGGSE